MNQSILMLLIFTDEVDFPPANTRFMITEDGKYMLMEGSTTKMVTEIS